MSKTSKAIVVLFAAPAVAGAGEIDRQALVARHAVVVTNAAAGFALQVGNGEFAFGADATGLQAARGCTLAQWGWHTFPLPAGLRPEDFKLTPYEARGRSVGYATGAKGQEALYAWLRENPHRLNLGRLRLLLDGRPVEPGSLAGLRQELDLWRGLLVTRYALGGQPVCVEACCHPTRDCLAVRVESPLAAAGRLALDLSFPYGSPGVSGANWERPQSHETALRVLADGPEGRAEVSRRLDDDRYEVALAWRGASAPRVAAPHALVVAPAAGAAALELACGYSARPDARPLPDFAAVKAASAEGWLAFWTSGGAIDLSGSRDPRWRELERRLVLSQYLLAVNEAGSLPPQESGLYNNSGWYGKFHLEMHWWHGAHYALWGRWPLFERSLGWYFRTLPAARALARSQGFAGARWPKMVGPEGRDSPSGVGPLLIWQQPHPIFYAELDYRLHPARATLEKWREVVDATADFMASFAVRDPATGRYSLGPPLKTVPENTDPRTAVNPAFELSYWRFGLRVAGTWRERLGLAPEPAWGEVLGGLAPLPQTEGAYLLQEGMADTYTKWNWEHPSLVGPLGLLPGDGADPAVMRATVEKVWQTWQWDRKTWGWDFPLLALAAARNGMPEAAVDALLHPAARNRMDEAGLSAGGPYPYFPSNGGLLYAAALMAAGWDGAPARPAPGFPADGSWTVKWEGLKPAP